MDEKTKRLFFEIHAGNPREGPGGREATERAFSSIPSLPDRPRILDIGCGPGAQTIDIVEISGHSVVALDFYPQYLRQLSQEAGRKDLLTRITPIQGDMNALPFKPRSFDLIWSEGAVYIMGLEKGLNAWKPLLKSKGCIALTDIAWLKDNPPEELRAFFAEEVPGMTGIDQTIKIIEHSGYHLIDYFILEEDAWWNYYTPIEKKLGSFREKHRDDYAALNVIKMEETEIAMYRKYSDEYGYIFYIIQSTS